MVSVRDVLGSSEGTSLHEFLKEMLPELQPCFSEFGGVHGELTVQSLQDSPLFRVQTPNADRCLRLPYSESQGVDEIDGVICLSADIGVFKKLVPPHRQRFHGTGLAGGTRAVTRTFEKSPHILRSYEDLREGELHKLVFVIQLPLVGTRDGFMLSAFIYPDRNHISKSAFPAYYNFLNGKRFHNLLDETYKEALVEMRHRYPNSATSELHAAAVAGMDGGRGRLDFLPYILPEDLDVLGPIWRSKLEDTLDGALARDSAATRYIVDFGICDAGGQISYSSLKDYAMFNCVDSSLTRTALHLVRNLTSVVVEDDENTMVVVRKDNLPTQRKPGYSTYALLGCPAAVNVHAFNRRFEFDVKRVRDEGSVHGSDNGSVHSSTQDINALLAELEENEGCGDGNGDGNGSVHLVADNLSADREDVGGDDGSVHTVADNIDGAQVRESEMRRRKRRPGLQRPLYQSKKPFIGGARFEQYHGPEGRTGIVSGFQLYNPNSHMFPSASKHEKADKTDPLLSFAQMVQNHDKFGPFSNAPVTSYVLDHFGFDELYCPVEPPVRSKCVNLESMVEYSRAIERLRRLENQSYPLRAEIIVEFFGGNDAFSVLDVLCGTNLSDVAFEAIAAFRNSFEVWRTQSIVNDYTLKVLAILRILSACHMLAKFMRISATPPAGKWINYNLAQTALVFEFALRSMDRGTIRHNCGDMLKSFGFTDKTFCFNADLFRFGSPTLFNSAAKKEGVALWSIAWVKNPVFGKHQLLTFAKGMTVAQRCILDAHHVFQTVLGLWKSEERNNRKAAQSLITDTVYILAYHYPASRILQRVFPLETILSSSDGRFVGLNLPSEGVLQLHSGVVSHGDREDASDDTDAEDEPRFNARARAEHTLPGYIRKEKPYITIPLRDAAIMLLNQAHSPIRHWMKVIQAAFNLVEEPSVTEVETALMRLFQVGLKYVFHESSVMEGRYSAATFRLLDPVQTYEFFLRQMDRKMPASLPVATAARFVDDVKDWAKDVFKVYRRFQEMCRFDVGGDARGGRGRVASSVIDAVRNWLEAFLLRLSCMSETEAGKVIAERFKTLVKTSYKDAVSAVMVAATVSLVHAMKGQTMLTGGQFSYVDFKMRNNWDERLSAFGLGRDAWVGMRLVEIAPFSKSRYYYDCEETAVAALRAEGGPFYVISKNQRFWFDKRSSEKAQAAGNKMDVPPQGSLMHYYEHTAREDAAVVGEMEHLGNLDDQDRVEDDYLPDQSHRTLRFSKYREVLQPHRVVDEREMQESAEDAQAGGESDGGERQRRAVSPTSQDQSLPSAGAQYVDRSTEQPTVRKKRFPTPLRREPVPVGVSDDLAGAARTTKLKSALKATTSAMKEITARRKRRSRVSRKGSARKAGKDYSKENDGSRSSQVSRPSESVEVEPLRKKRRVDPLIALYGVPENTSVLAVQPAEERTTVESVRAAEPAEGRTTLQSALAVQPADDRTTVQSVLAVQPAEERRAAQSVLAVQPAEERSTVEGAVAKVRAAHGPSHDGLPATVGAHPPADLYSANSSTSSGDEGEFEGVEDESRRRRQRSGSSSTPPARTHRKDQLKDELLQYKMSDRDVIDALLQHVGSDGIVYLEPHADRGSTAQMLGIYNSVVSAPGSRRTFVRFYNEIGKNFPSIGIAGRAALICSAMGNTPIIAIEVEEGNVLEACGFTYANEATNVAIAVERALGGEVWYRIYNGKHEHTRFQMKMHVNEMDAAVEKARRDRMEAMPVRERTKMGKLSRKNAEDVRLLNNSDVPRLMTHVQKAFPGTIKYNKRLHALSVITSSTSDRVGNRMKQSLPNALAAAVRGVVNKTATWIMDEMHQLGGGTGDSEYTIEDVQHFCHRNNLCAVVFNILRTCDGDPEFICYVHLVGPIFKFLREDRQRVIALVVTTNRDKIPVQWWYIGRSGSANTGVQFTKILCIRFSCHQRRAYVEDPDVRKQRLEKNLLPIDVAAPVASSAYSQLRIEDLVDESGGQKGKRPIVQEPSTSEYSQEEEEAERRPVEVLCRGPAVQPAEKPTTERMRRGPAVQPAKKPTTERMRREPAVQPAKWPTSELLRRKRAVQPAEQSTGDQETRRRPAVQSANEPTTEVFRRKPAVQPAEQSTEDQETRRKPAVQTANEPTTEVFRRKPAVQPAKQSTGVKDTRGRPAVQPAEMRMTVENLRRRPISTAQHADPAEFRQLYVRQGLSCPTLDSDLCRRLYITFRDSIRVRPGSKARMEEVQLIVKKTGSFAAGRSLQCLAVALHGSLGHVLAMDSDTISRLLTSYNAAMQVPREEFFELTDMLKFCFESTTTAIVFQVIESARPNVEPNKIYLHLCGNVRGFLEENRGNEIALLVNHSSPSGQGYHWSYLSRDGNGDDIITGQLEGYLTHAPGENDLAEIYAV